MNNKQFISALKKALAGLDKASRNDIIQEINSHGLESDSPLVDQFGSAEELAQQYLDGEKIAKPISSKIWGFSKKVLMGIGVAVVSLVALIGILSYTYAKDKFDYANENADELSANNSGWKSEAWSADINLDIDQASAVIYWHDDNSVRWNCEGDDPEKQSDSSLLIRHSHCLMYLPKTTINLNAIQSQIVLVRPQVSIVVNARQGSVKVAENGEQYIYRVEGDRSAFKGLESYDEAEHTLQFTIKESMVAPYKY